MSREKKCPIQEAELEAERAAEERLLGTTADCDDPYFYDEDDFND